MLFILQLSCIPTQLSEFCTNTSSFRDYLIVFPGNHYLGVAFYNWPTWKLACYSNTYTVPLSCEHADTAHKWIRTVSLKTFYFKPLQKQTSHYIPILPLLTQKEKTSHFLTLIFLSCSPFSNSHSHFSTIWSCNFTVWERTGKKWKKINFMHERRVAKLLNQCITYLFT